MLPTGIACPDGRTAAAAAPVLVAASVLFAASAAETFTMEVSARAVAVTAEASFQREGRRTEFIDRASVDFCSMCVPPSMPALVVKAPLRAKSVWFRDE
ncbi:hypothetical protein Ahu01nite_001020 [Winogradskya humida]|uniref:Secreted protein n=1 Tax=Winogradskya humida TaxID=113566 RepID=A0ABQ3ZEJ1_9ACTN|nr:hypothetical protein Ahu01nite_001020 [Actinoplanes humidus]